MHQGVLAARDQIARERITAAITALAARYGLPVDVAAITAAQGHDKFERSMKQKEAVAVCLEQLLAGLPEPETEKPRRNRKQAVSDGVPE